MNKTPVIVNGASGRMGQVTCSAIESSPDFALAARCDHQDNLGKMIQDVKAAIVVDFTSAGQGFANTMTILEAGARPVIGTTGWTENEIAELDAFCRKNHRGAIIGPNFSIAAILMMKFAMQAAAFFPHVEIIEMHHDKKLDAPSGTAVKTAKLISESRKTSFPHPSIHENYPGSRGALCFDIPVHAVRLPGAVAHQEVIFGDQGELLKIRHDSMDRVSFMPGVLLACRKVLTLDHLVYGLENLI